MIRHNAGRLEGETIEQGFRELIVKTWENPEEVDDEAPSSVPTVLISRPVS